MPPKKMNEKKESAKEKEEAKRGAAKDKSDKDSEDAYWKGQGEGDKGKGGQRKEEEERKKQEQAAKRAELKRLQDEETATLSAPKSKLAPAGIQKMTKYQLDKQREQDEKLKAEELEEKGMSSRREVDEDAYHRSVAHENVNRVGDGGLDARSVDGALAALNVGGGPEEEKHPEKRMKGAWKAFEERELVQLKLDKPGMKMSQYKDLLWKMWQKSPLNPMVQAGRA
mmetsp:Transcript_4492/g.7568  ORF Transcript_4492/g.7568 Transcript_4492/m.7568 type:complete len:226 (+) Transcript_4492:144-821(+)|eukprot:CAMPEP_0119103570 /NCGR_PEP_ID=MMETSP1180-20130426/1987_1 /TAXON_ID=3052 ORGANISM="Chlamydomonas cf sp, Strain CCMP681" /NCGR_SAMPLE_ID=MMETSP1180 /ASSEMBLY_ACC=CAM_ASM_000741 /LENGTH=225 /DNA_ID=CAMNT_0007088119 /DNA_START=144 /DNA_END=821 /DNA_ORIENTATION=-